MGLVSRGGVEVGALKLPTRERGGMEWERGTGAGGVSTLASPWELETPRSAQLIRLGQIQDDSESER